MNGANALNMFIPVVFSSVVFFQLQCRRFRKKNECLKGAFALYLLFLPILQLPGGTAVCRTK